MNSHHFSLIAVARIKCWLSVYHSAIQLIVLGTKKMKFFSGTSQSFEFLLDLSFFKLKSLQSAIYDCRYVEFFITLVSVSELICH